MKTELTINSDINVVDIDVVNTAVTLKDIIDEYKAIAVKLSLFADAIPETSIEQKELIEKEEHLLDKQAGLLETALSYSVKNLDDAKAIMTLWHHEVVQSQSTDSLSAADELVNSVFDFLKAA